MTEPFSPVTEDDPNSRPVARGFRVVSRQPAYQPAERCFPGWLAAAGEGSSEHGCSGHDLFLVGAAARAIYRQVGWGTRTAANRVEQGGLLLGHVYRDVERGVVYGVVGKTVPAVGARSSAAHIEISTATWGEMLALVDRRDGEREELQVIGWYHTHPNDLSIFMSGVDGVTQKRLFDHDWHFSLVLNPQQQLAGAFHGRDATSCHLRIDPALSLPADFFTTSVFGELRGPSLPAAEEPPTSAAGERSSHLGTDGPQSPTSPGLRLGTGERVGKVRRWLRKLTKRRPRFSPQRSLVVTVDGEDAAEDLVRVRIEGWVPRATARRLLGDWR